MNNTNIHTQTVINQSWSPASNRIQYRFTFAFANREQYCEFVRLWKIAYAQSSLVLREQKLLVRTTQRQREYAGQQQVRLLELQKVATMQLAMRHAAKGESHRQYLAAKQMAG